MEASLCVEQLKARDSEAPHPPVAERTVAQRPWCSNYIEAVYEIPWKLLIAPQAAQAAAEPYPLSEKLEGPSPACRLPALDQLEGGDVIGDWAPLPQPEWRGVREICFTG